MKIGQFVILMCLLIASRLHAADCIYVSKQTTEDPHLELSSQGKCGQFETQDIFRLSDEHFNNLRFSEAGLAWFLYEGGAFYVTENRKLVRTYLFENAADNFVEGLARTLSNGKFGYMDEQLNIAIEPEYDFAFPFKNGIAIVCIGCRMTLDGEHGVVDGGKWGAIDRSGKIVVPLINSKNTLHDKFPGAF